MPDRVSDDVKRARQGGLPSSQSSSYDTDKGVAEIELVTKRTDTQAYFAKRYGKLVKPIVTGTETTVLGVRAVDRVQDRRPTA